MESTNATREEKKYWTPSPNSNCHLHLLPTKITPHLVAPCYPWTISNRPFLHPSWTHKNHKTCQKEIRWNWKWPHGTTNHSPLPENPNCSQNHKHQTEENRINDTILRQSCRSAFQSQIEKFVEELNESNKELLPNDVLKTFQAYITQSACDLAEETIHSILTGSLNLKPN